MNNLLLAENECRLHSYPVPIISYFRMKLCIRNTLMIPARLTHILPNLHNRGLAVGFTREIRDDVCLRELRDNRIVPRGLERYPSDIFADLSTDEEAELLWGCGRRFGYDLGDCSA